MRRLFSLFFQNREILLVFVILVDPIIIVQDVFRSFISQHSDRAVVNCIYALSRIRCRDAFPGTDEQRDFIEGNIDPVDAL